MLFVSAGIDDKSGKRQADPGPAEQAQALAERTAVIHEACRFLATGAQALPQAAGRPVRLAQALLEHRENDAGEAFAAAGFLRLGDLAYLRRPIAGLVGESGARARAGPLPSGVRAIRVDLLEPAKAADLLLAALERTYIDTLDCPELCGVRRVGDVLESHRSVGDYDPSLWWVVVEADRAEGCMLFNPNPAQDAVELVYLGLSPRLRGRGIGSALLGQGLASLADVPLSSVCCAVDTRNTPALRLYAGAGFERADARIPYVKPLGPGAP
jgi:mycothiol synthase